MTTMLGAMPKAEPAPVDPSLDDISVMGSGSVQLMFAKLQLKQSSLSKDRAIEYMNKIKGIQALQKETAEWISKARALAEGGGKMPAEMVAFFKLHKLAVGGGKDPDPNKEYSKDEWKINVQSLTNFQESVGSETQTHMVYLQDFIGQYNSFLQGANSTIATANQVMTNIARGQ